MAGLFLLECRESNEPLGEPAVITDGAHLRFASSLTGLAGCVSPLVGLAEICRNPLRHPGDAVMVLVHGRLLEVSRPDTTAAYAILKTDLARKF